MTIIRVGYVIGFAIGCALIGLALLVGTTWTERWVNVLIYFSAGVVGWLAGILLTPETPGQDKRFNDYGKAILTFISGFAAAKLDHAYEAAMRNGDLWANPDFKVGVLLAIAGFALGTLFTAFPRLKSMFA
jgi:hypothetical protein